jgi:hypothetical protein
VLGFDRALDGDEVFRDLVLARIIEPTTRSIRCGCSLRPESSRRRIGPSSAGFLCSLNLLCAKHYRNHVLRMPG